MAIRPAPPINKAAGKLKPASTGWSTARYVTALMVAGNSVIGRGLYPPAPDITDAKTQEQTDGELFYIISNGVRLTGMPAWQGEDSPEEIWDLVSFIRHLPQITPEELKQMKEMSGEETAEGNRVLRLREKIPNRRAVLLGGSDYLLSFSNRHTWTVLSLNYEKRSLDFVRIV